MATKTKVASARGITPPLTRRERRAAKEARYYGLDAFSYRTEIPHKRGLTKTVALMSDIERAIFFDLLESFCELGESLRGVN